VERFSDHDAERPVDRVELNGKTVLEDAQLPSCPVAQLPSCPVSPRKARWPYNITAGSMRRKGSGTEPRRWSSSGMSMSRN